MSKMILKGILTTTILGGLMISAAIAQTTTGSTKPAGSNPAAATPAAKSTTAAPAAAKADMVDINTASKADLMKLPGMTDAEAAKIIAGRPYKMKTQLKSGKVVSDAEYAKISDMIIAKQAGKK